LLFSSSIVSGCANNGGDECINNGDGGCSASGGVRRRAGRRCVFFRALLEARGGGKVLDNVRLRLWRLLA